MGDINDKVQIKLKKGGWEVDITCSEDKIKQAVENVLNGLSNSIKETPDIGEKPSDKRNVTCRGLLEEMWKEGWFEKERNLLDVHEELARKGYHYDRTAVSHSLTDLVRENIFTRVGMMRSYRYIQKKPPT